MKVSTSAKIIAYLSILIKVLFGRILSYFYKDIPHLWLICERGTDARDNGYVFFKYMKQNHPEIKVKYIISSSSPDYHKLSEYKADLIEYSSINNYAYLFKAQALVSTHICGYVPDPTRFIKLDKKLNVLRNKRKIFLQHGIIKDLLNGLFYSKINLDLFICGAAMECDFVKSHFGYPEGVVQYTGLCRYDNLNNYVCKNQILIMPTWRMYLEGCDFSQSDYFKYYSELLTNRTFHQLLQENNFEAIFYPHYEVQKYIDLFKKLDLPKSIKIADFSYDVQTLLKESKVLLTDYSSVYFDMAYMGKPILIYSFDSDTFFSKHYKKGYISGANFGPSAKTLPELLANLKSVFNHDCEMQEPYKTFSSSFFKLRDSNNCDRVFNAINNIVK